MPDVDRAEFEALSERVRRLESTLGAYVARCPSCSTPLRAEWRFCATCGAPTGRAGAPPAAVPAPATPPPPRPAAPPAARAPPPPALTSARPAAPAPRASLETLVGQRFAPRLGALLVFLAALFFLGLGIQRGWIGPIAQLFIATLFGLALVGTGIALARRGGYGAYPQILVGTGASIVYVVAFVAHALDYYERATGLTELGSGLLMAAVALTTVGGALWLDARPIVGLGYALAFLTAAMGWGVLPDLTLVYVALLGTSLALVVLWKGWAGEAALGTLGTGALFLLLAWGDAPGAPDDAIVALVAAIPVAAFLALAIRPPRAALGDEGAIHAMVGLATLAWASVVSLAPLPREERWIGVALLAWTAVAIGLAWSARSATTLQRRAPAIAAAAFYAIGIPLVWTGVQEADFLATASYAAAGIALVAVARGRVGFWTAGSVMAALAGARALASNGVLSGDALVGGDALLGPWQAWAMLLALAPLLALLVLRAPQGTVAAGALLGSAAFLAFWGLAIVRAPFLLTMWLLALAATAAFVASRRPALADAATGAALLLVGLAGLKVATIDAHGIEPPMPMPLAALETLLVAGLLLGLHHTRAVGRFDATRAKGMAIVLVGGSALVLASWAFAYLARDAVSATLGLLGVAYLVAGFVMRSQDVYRWTGFGVLGFVLLRVFLVDLSRTDLAVRAGIFALLGLILLGVGYAYARAARKGAPPGEAPKP